MNQRPTQWQWVWKTALACFILAGSTGILLRFGIIYGFPGNLQYSNVRHAHSHLMYFGWVTPAIMGLMLNRLPVILGRPLSPHRIRPFRNILILIFTLSILAYIPFLFYGYRTANIGTARLPLSTIAASLNMVAWYLFAWQYRQETKGEPRTRPLRLWDAAIIFMIFATMGAWGVALTAVLAIQDPVWSSILTHLFLDMFAEGWFALAVLGLLYASIPPQHHKWLRRSEDWIIMGMPVIFLLGVPTGMLPLPVRFIAGVGGAAVAIGLGVHIVHLWPIVSRAWRVPLLFLGLKAVTNLLITIPAIATWAERALLRVSYLHWLLLGFVSLSLVATAKHAWGKRTVPHVGWLTAVITLLILSLLPLTGLWPPALHGIWTRHFAAWAATGPVLIVLAMFSKQLLHIKQPTTPTTQLTIDD
ncbi:MAG: hypothetical protein GY943_25095 [Chloroflexi bacterium]|nr:hypothetical protein [Chloroflexota bacterium]